MLLLVLIPLVVAVPYWPGSALENNQYYTVVFDEEGEAAVMAKLMFQNTEKTKMENLVLEFPGYVQIINVVQEVQQERERYGWEFAYKTVDYERIGSSVIFELEEAIDEQDKAILLIYYKARGFTEKNLGVYDFEFETIKSKRDTNHVRVAINVQEGLYLKGVEGKIKYVDNFLAMKSYGAAEAISPEMASFSRSLEHSQGLVKTASGLDPFENFRVSGEYSGSWLWLNIWRVIGGIAVVGLLLLGLISGFRKIRIGKSRNKEVGLLSFVSAISSVGVIALCMWLINNLRHWISYRGSEIPALLIVFTTVVLVLAALIVPPIYLGKKYKNYLVGIATVLLTVGWLVLLGLVMTLSFAIF